jgi:hypothetical protein
MYDFLTICVMFFFLLRAKSVNSGMKRPHTYQLGKNLQKLGGLGNALSLGALTSNGLSCHF